MKLVLVARREDRIRALAEELGDAAVAIAADVGVAAQVAAVFDQVRERVGGLDLLFNNAAVGIYGAFLESKPEDWKIQIDANIDDADPSR
jgi:NADP-dependent 3-hydroxy acid dehydrogenase YdfG